MTWQFDPNIFVLAAADKTGRAWTALKDLGVLHGALVVLGSGDGIAAFENSGDTAGPFDVLTGGVSSWNSLVANEFSNTEAWMRLRETGSTREWVIMRSSLVSAASEDDIVIAFSPTGFVATGVATANLPPTPPADVQFLVGTAYATTQAWGPTTSVDTRIHVAIEDTAQGGVFPFWLVCRRTATGIANGSFVYESLEQGIAGDAQPWASMVPASASTALTRASLANKWGTYRDYGGGSEIWLNGRTTIGASPCGIEDGSSNVLFPSGVPPQDDGDARDFPIPISRAVAGIWRGVARNIKWKGTAGRDYPDTVDLASASARVYFDEILFPWEQGTVPLS